MYALGLDSPISMVRQTNLSRVHRPVAVKVFHAKFASQTHIVYRQCLWLIAMGRKGRKGEGKKVSGAVVLMESRSLTP